MNKPEHTLTCWLIDADEFARITVERPFAPVYQPYLFFQITARVENTVEGHLGHSDRGVAFHKNWDSTLSYFNAYQQRSKQYFTFDKVNFYELAEIIPSDPFLFVLQKHRDQPMVPASGKRAAVAGTTHRLHFEELGGDHFERLVFAYIQRIMPDAEVEWLGETGKDKGRDIWAKGPAGSHCFHCANYRELTFTKAGGDIDSLVKHQLIPEALTVICGGRVANQLRDRIKAYGVAAGIPTVAVWSGSELEAKLREKASDLVQRFFEGVVFPVSPGLPVAEMVDADPAEELPELILNLLPSLNFNGTDDELTVFLNEAFYHIGKNPPNAFVIRLEEEAGLNGRINELSKAPKSVPNRNSLLYLRKLVDMLPGLKAELAKKVRLLSVTDLYSARGDDAALAIIFRELLKLCFTGVRIQEELALEEYPGAGFEQVKAEKFNGDHKIAVYKDHTGVIGFNVWLTTAEYKDLRSKVPGTEKLSEMDFSIIGFECSDFSRDVLIRKAIPGFVDAIYDYQQRGTIAEDDHKSWNFLHAYRLTTG